MASTILMLALFIAGKLSSAKQRFLMNIQTETFLFMLLIIGLLLSYNEPSLYVHVATRFL
jgi:hypothetical protein